MDATNLTPGLASWLILGGQLAGQARQFTGQDLEVLRPENATPSQISPNRNGAPGGQKKTRTKRKNGQGSSETSNCTKRADWQLAGKMRSASAWLSVIPQVGPANWRGGNWRPLSASLPKSATTYKRALPLHVVTEAKRRLSGRTRIWRIRYWGSLPIPNLGHDAAHRTRN